MRITSEHSPLSFLSQRLAYASRNRIRAINLVENVPVWPARFRPELHERAQPDIFHYAPAEGDETLLRLLLERENARAGEEDGTLTTRNILVTNGATQGLSLLLGLLDPRRPTILCQSPAFIGITALMQARGYIVRHCPVGTDLVDWMSSTLSDDVAAIYVNTPHNPTGSVLPAASLQALIDRAGMHGARVIVDAVYEDFVFDGQCCHLPRQPDCEHVAVLNSVSKNFGAPGLRIGWIVAAAKDVAQLTGDLERECVAVCSDAQVRAAEIVSRSNGPLVAHVDAARGAVFDMLRAIPGLEFETCSAGTQVMAHSDVDDVEAFADFALARYGLILATSRNYSGMRSQSIRIPLGQERDRIAQGLDMLDSSIRSYRETVHAVRRSA
ncbi:aminotransferase class I/II-fold pyridoxal phosphate-dependent enzyme [Achromobacter sp. AONIH1]|uniref:aminotransferase class I/II-fold pyridoxal phosphate-dependent enzyme n=1 Tax=unclassified Achromobacter TaxID=2626865 RepID=UPI001319F9B1|nr:aminotransferase class I/II-fold pyridoxal phosphate-dependent enzyme [Achromobacter sp. AONIH1]